MILDCEVDIKFPIILDKLFLDTRRAIVDAESGELKFWVNDKEVTSNVCKSIRKPNDLQVHSFIDVVDDTIATADDMLGLDESLAATLLKNDSRDIEDYDEMVTTLLGLGLHFKTFPRLDIELKNQ